MEFKDSKNLTNLEIKEYMSNLEKEFESLKYKIKEECELLDKLGVEYNSAEEELQKRNVK